MASDSSHSPQTYSGPGRRLILLLDGTRQRYSTRSTNVFRLYAMLRKDDESSQVVYYQPGIGTTDEPRQFSQLTDLMFAHTLKSHLISAYKFVVNNYNNSTKDKIYIFGYSRGGHTARALAGMIHKVGLVPKYNDEQVNEAYRLYERSDKEGWELCKRFKEIHRITPEIEFMGLWDTVSSVGFVPRHLPFTKLGSVAKVFRHALSLDERRARFSPDTFKPSEEWLSQQQRKRGKAWEKLQREQDFIGPRKPDVLEVWFAGCHSDVGGGSVRYDTTYSHSRISLRWMIHQCFSTKTGLIFEEGELRKIGLDPATLYPEVKPRRRSEELRAEDLVKAFKILAEEGKLDLDESRLQKGRRKASFTSVLTFSPQVSKDQSSTNEQTPGQQSLTPDSDSDPAKSEEELIGTDTETIEDLIDALTPIHDPVQDGLVWKLLGVHIRRPDRPMVVHPTVYLRLAARKLVREPTQDPEVKLFAKLLGLEKYVPRVEIDSLCTCAD